MILRRHKSKYESEVHLGFMAIIFLLVFLNVVSNYVIFKARSAQQEETLAHLRRAAISVSRLVQMNYPQPLSPDGLKLVRSQNGLVGLNLIPVKPIDKSEESRRDWFRAVLRLFPPSLYPDMANKLYQADMQELTRGENSEYYYLYPIPAGAGNNLLVLTVDRADLAYLDDARHTLMVVLLSAVAIVLAVYVLLSRFMFRPFRRLRQQAEQAGRPVDDSEDETEAVVEEYQRVIEQLTESKTELLRLNEEVGLRADSLELFNRYLMESSHSGVVTLDLYGRVVAVNDTALKVLRISTGDFAGRKYEQLFVGHDELVADVSRALEDGTTLGYREYAGNADRQPDAQLGVTLTEILDRDREMTGLLLMINDLTEIGRLRTELENQKRLAALGEMAGGLAHQIRNILGTINGYATLLKKHLKEEKLSVGYATALLEESREADELINRFLSFARPFEYSPRITDVGQLVEECLESFRARQDDCSVELRTSFQVGVMAEADPILLKQAIGNLIDNAIQAYEGGRVMVEVGVGTESEMVVVTVRDRGCGISRENLDKIFTPFFSSRPSGTGLGLPLAAKIIALHGGMVEIDSEPGKGSEFKISFPLATEPSTGATRRKISHQV